MAVIKERSGIFSLAKYVFFIAVILFLLPDSKESVSNQQSNLKNSGSHSVQTSFDTIGAIKNDLLSICDRSPDICLNGEVLAKDVSHKVLDGVLVVIDSLKNNQIVDNTIKSFPVLAETGEYIEGQLYNQLGYSENNYQNIDLNNNSLKFELGDAETTSSKKSDVMGSAKIKQILSTAAINNSTNKMAINGVDTLSINDLLPEWSGPDQKS